MNFNTLMADLARMGVWDIILPFMLIFTIVYATLTTTLKGMFGKEGDNDRTKFAIIIALVVALGVVIPHSIGAYPRGADVVDIINASLPQVGLIAVAIIGLMILLGMFGINSSKWGGKGIQLFIIVIAAGLILYIFGHSAGWFMRWPRWLNFLNDGDTQALIIALLVFGLIVKLIVGNNDDDDKEDGITKLGKLSTALFGDGKEGDNK
jgi:amino acid transporter